MFFAKFSDKIVTCSDYPNLSVSTQTMSSSRVWTGIASNYGGIENLAFAAIADGPTDQCASSTDGITWTDRSIPITGGASFNWSDIDWNGTYFMAVAGFTPTVAYSADGVSWFTTSIPAGFANGGNAVAGYQNRSIALSYETATAYSTNNGVTWFAGGALSTSTGRTRGGLAWNGSIFCALGSGTTYWTSADGVAWTTRTFPVTLNAQSAITADPLTGKFCVVGTGSGNKSHVSTDGINWTQGTMASATSGWNDITWNGVIFCAVAGSPFYDVNISTDGLFWCNVVATINGIPTVAWNGGVFCIVGTAPGTTSTATTTAFTMAFP